MSSDSIPRSKPPSQKPKYRMVQWEQNPIRENNSSQHDTYKGNYEELACGLIYEKYYNKLQHKGKIKWNIGERGHPRRKDPQPAIQFKFDLAKEEKHLFSKTPSNKTRFSK